MPDLKTEILKLCDVAANAVEGLHGEHCVGPVRECPACREEFELIARVRELVRAMESIYDPAASRN